MSSLNEFMKDTPFFVYSKTFENNSIRITYRKDSKPNTKEGVAMRIENHRNLILEENREIIEEILNNHKYKRPIYVMGLNFTLDNIIYFLKNKGIQIDGIIDDFSNKEEYLNIPVFPLKSIKSRNCIIIISANVRPLTIKRKLLSNGYDKIIFYFHLYLLEEEMLNTIIHCNNNIRDIDINKNKYYELYNKMADLNSKNTLQNLINFRYNFDAKPMESYSCNTEEQYFDSVIQFSKNEVFVDCGGYDGDTTKRFIEKNPNYAKIYFFEPYIEYYNLAMRNLNQYKNISFFQKATYNNNAFLKFVVAKEASAIDEKGEITIEASKLDDIIKEKVTFIKMDVEGAEYESVLGAKNLIQQYKPKLAICVYHKQEHFWKIPELVLNINNDYEIYLRHYSEGFSETVMYFV